MCSSPKGGTTKPHLSTKVEGTFSNMSAADYSDMVKRANESYEQRQLDLAKMRKNRKQVTVATPLETHPVSFYKKLKDLLTQLNFTDQKNA